MCLAEDYVLVYVSLSERVKDFDGGDAELHEASTLLDEADKALVGKDAITFLGQLVYC